MEKLQLKELVAECAPLVVGARVENVHQSPGECLCVSLYQHGKGRLILLFCLHTGLARFHLVSRRPAALVTPPPFCGALRKHLRGAHVEALVAEDERPAVRLALRSSGGGERSRAFILVFDLRERRGRLSLVDERGKALQTLEGSSRDDGDAPATAPAQSTAVATPLPPLHARLAELYADREVQASADERRAALRRQLKRALAKRERLLARVGEDLDRALRGKEDGQRGELLKGALGKVRRGMRSVVVQNYFDAAMPDVEVPLDPARTPLENVELYFKRYRKAQRGVPVIEERLARLADERDSMMELSARLADASAALDLDQLEKQARSLCGRAAAPSRGKRAGTGESARSGPRRYVSADGLEVLVGRSASGNDELTFHIARGNDLFLHVSGRPGSHVIVRLDRERALPPETLLDAACLAVYFSLPQRSRSRAAGAVAEVDYTPVKHVRRPRGAPAGRVLLASHKTVRVRIEPHRLERLLGGTDA